MEASSTEKRIDDLSGRVGRFEDRFERFEDKVEARFDKVGERFDKVDQKFSALEARMDAGFKKADDRFVTKEEFWKANEVTVARLDKIDERLDNWGRLIGGGVVAIFVTIIGAVVLKLIGA